MKSDFATPAMSVTGRKTMQIQSVETSAGTAISAAPSRMARSTGLPIACWRWKFSTSTVASSTRMPTASAIPPSVMRLIVCPNQLSTMIETRSESGMEVITTTVERQVARAAHRPVALLDGKIVEPSDHVWAAVHEHVVFEGTDLRGAARQDHVLLIHGRRHVRGRDSPGEHLLRIDVDHDRAHLAAIRQRDLRALYRRQAGAQEVRREIVHLLLRQR